VSGAIRWQDRPGLRKAFIRCTAREADVIVAYHQDRFARKMGVFEDIRDTAVDRRIRLETTDGRVITGKNDFLNGDVLSLVSAIERRRISERFYAARRLRSTKDGCGSGPLPWGYLRSGDGELVLDMAAAAVIRRLLVLRRNGATYQATADDLNEAGYRTPKGSEWTVGHVQGIERHEVLYRTGRRTWDDVTADLRWPVIVGEVST
jgi:DNA invertase Pin-like site-specific DNA recombinase